MGAKHSSMFLMKLQNIFPIMRDEIVAIIYRQPLEQTSIFSKFQNLKCFGPKKFEKKPASQSISTIPAQDNLLIRFLDVITDGQ